MKKIIKSISLLAALTLGLGTLSSCSDDEDTTTLSRLFRPILSSDNIKTGLDAQNVPYIQVKWDNYATADKYQLVLVPTNGQDSIVAQSDTSVYTFSNLDYDLEYNLKIKALNTTQGIESAYYTTSVTTTDYPTLLKSISTADVIDTQVRVSWDRKDGTTVYDSLRIYTVEPDSLVGSFAVKASDLEAGNKIIRGLKSKTTYRVEAFNEGLYLGKKVFKTVAPENFTGTVIDLRGLDEDTSYKYFSTSSSSAYANTIDSLIQTTYPDQDITFVLQGGVSYRLPNLALPSTTGTIRFVTGLSLSGLATFDVTGNFDTAAGAAIGGIAFDKINISGAQPNEGDGNFGGKYLFNFSQNDSKVGTISITNSNIKWKRGVCRVKAGTQIEHFIIDNCLIDSIGGYGVINADNGKAVIRNAHVTNSTLSNCQVLFAGTKGIAPNSLVIENVTFYLCGASNKSITDFKGKAPAEGITLRNCLFGPGYGATPADRTLSGWTGDVVPTMQEGLYFTSDVVWRLGADGITPSAQLLGTTLSGASDAVFRNPSANDYTNISTELGGDKPKPGDPRWY